MKKRSGTVLLALICLSILFTGCTTAEPASKSTGTIETSDTSSVSGGSVAEPDSTPEEPVTTAEPEEPEIPSGSIALFATLSGDTQSDFLRVESGTVNWDTTHYKLLRYIPEMEQLDEFGWTSSKSYSKTFIYGITAGGWIYEVKCFTDSGRKDIIRKDPKTGATVGQFGSITTSDMYEGFTIAGDKLLYRTKINKDLMGNRTSGGNVMVMRFGQTTAAEALDYYNENNMGGYYAIGDELITIASTWEDGTTWYDIYRVDPASLVVGELLYSFGSEEYVEFFSGETSLFWSEEIPGVDGVYIVRFTLTETPVYFLEITESVPQLLTVDESNGKALITFKDNTPESPFYYLADMDSNAIEELDVDPAFFSTLKNGNGQFLIID